MSYKATSGIFALSALLLSTTSIAHADSSDGTGFGLSLRVPLICDARLEQVTPVASGLQVEIRELCNGGTGYELQLLHDGQGIRSLTYNNMPVAYDSAAPTVLATRTGPYHGRRTLFIETNGTTPRIFGVAVNRTGSRL